MLAFLQVEEGRLFRVLACKCSCISVFSRVRGLTFAGCRLILIDVHLAAVWPISPHLSHVVSGCLYWSRSSGLL